MKPPPNTPAAFVEMVDRELEQARARALETLRAPRSQEKRGKRTRAPRRLPALERIRAERAKAAQ